MVVEPVDLFGQVLHASQLIPCAILVYQDLDSATILPVMSSLAQPMHQIFTINEILQSIVLEYRLLENDTWSPGARCSPRTRGLATLARVKVFSPFALQLLWRDANLVQLASSSTFNWNSLGTAQSEDETVSLQSVSGKTDIESCTGLLSSKRVHTIHQSSTSYI